MASVSLDSEVDTYDTRVLEQMLPADPFRSLMVHFGMLLGVEDFKTLDSYHRGKMWLHSAWLHRQGTVWGLKVSADIDNSEISVSTGLAIDKLGRELYLDKDACLNLAQWYEEHKDDPELLDIIVIDEGAGTLSFNAHVIVQFKGCLARQVPAISEPCENANSTTAYSRVIETVELLLIPGPAPEWRTPAGSLPFHRLRLLFGLEEPLRDSEGAITDDDQDVLDARQTILALPAAQQPAEYLKWFRHFSALDEVEMEPEKGDDYETATIFPGIHPAPVPLANLSIQFSRDNGDWQLSQCDIDNTVRPVHVPTSTIQELLCGPLFTAAEAGEIPLPLPPVNDDAGGPRIESGSVAIDGEFIRFNATSPLLKSSVDARAISVTAFDTRDGWISAEIKNVDYETGSNLITVELRDAPGGNLVRLIVKGTGEYPILGRNKIPLAGAVDGLAGSDIDGNDFVTMFRIRS